MCALAFTDRNDSTFRVCRGTGQEYDNEGCASKCSRKKALRKFKNQFQLQSLLGVLFTFNWLA